MNIEVVPVDDIKDVIDMVFTAKEIKPTGEIPIQGQTVSILTASAGS